MKERKKGEDVSVLLFTYYFSEKWKQHIFMFLLLQFFVKVKKKKSSFAQIFNETIGKFLLSFYFIVIELESLRIKIHQKIQIGKVKP